MPYALFEGDQKLSRTFATKQEAVRKADEAGLVVDTTVAGEPVLESDLAIEPCSPDPEVGTEEELDRAVGKPLPSPDKAASE